MTTSATINTIIRIVLADGFATVRETIANGHKGLFSTQFFPVGAVLCAFSAREVLARPARLTLQTGSDQHILLQPEFLQYANHSCDPNIFFDTTNQQVRCLKNVQADDELTFFYPSTEWEMDEPFACHCGARACLREIQGAAFLSDEALCDYQLTDFIQQQRRAQARTS